MSCRRRIADEMSDVLFIEYMSLGFKVLCWKMRVESRSWGFNTLCGKRDGCEFGTSELGQNCFRSRVRGMETW